MLKKHAIALFLVLVGVTIASAGMNNNNKKHYRKPSGTSSWAKQKKHKATYPKKKSVLYEALEDVLEGTGGEPEVYYCRNIDGREVCKTEEEWNQ